MSEKKTGKKNAIIPPPLPGLKAERSRTLPGDARFFCRDMEETRTPRFTKDYHNAIGILICCFTFDIFNVLASEQSQQQATRSNNTNDVCPLRSPFEFEFISR